jgi:hypothetical protein
LHEWGALPHKGDIQTCSFVLPKTRNSVELTRHQEIIMKLRILVCATFVCSLAFAASQGKSSPVSTASASNIPHLRKQGTVTQLIVDGKPFLALAGELDNDAATSLENLRPIWPALVQMNLNTVLPVTYWELVEPEEGKFDFTLVDGLIQEARRRNLRLILIWFASWKNGLSSYAPLWVKKDFKRFPRVQTKRGTGLEVFSPIEGYGDATRDADARAFAAMMRHIKAVDGQQHTVIMIQVENEVGVLGDSRDRSPAADKAFAAPVPKELMDYLQQHRDTLIPEFRKVWEAAGSKTSGTWEEVFGQGAGTDEIFMAWHYARYVGRVAEAGKAEYPIPMYVNAWLYGFGRPNRPGGTPSGGPLPHVMDVWQAGAPRIDMLSPDLYNDFVPFSELYTRSGNPLFMPEAQGGPAGAARALYAFGHHDAIGHSVFLIESNPQVDPANELGRVYKSISQLMPLITAHQGKGTLKGVLVENGQTEKVQLGDYTMNVAYGAPGLRTWSSPPLPPQSAMPRNANAGALFILTAPDEFYVSASGAMTITFTPNTPGPPLVGVGSIDEGSLVDGRWVQGRRLDHRVTTNNEMGALRLVPVGFGGYARSDEHTILRVRLYRYQ